MKLMGARFEISIDGTPRTDRDRKPFAIEAPSISSAWIRTVQSW